MLRARSLRALLVATACFAVACGSAPAREAGPAHGNAKSPLQQLNSHPDLQIFVQTGTQHWAAGEVSLTVNGDGEVEVIQRQANGTHRFHGKLTKAETEELGLLLHKHRFTAPRTTTLPRQPGDTPLLLALRQGSTSLFDADLWNADRESDPDLEAILRAVEQLLYRVSNGTVGW